jgi:hypothetical protein
LALSAKLAFLDLQPLVRHAWGLQKDMALETRIGSAVRMEDIAAPHEFQAGGGHDGEARDGLLGICVIDAVGGDFNDRCLGRS